MTERLGVRSVFWRFGGGILLLLVAGMGLWQSVRATVAHAIMHEAHFGEARLEPDRSLVLQQRAYLYYPHSYHMAIHAASVAWYQYILAQEEGDARGAEHYLTQARHWTRIGLYRNPYPLPLRWLNQRLLDIGGSIDQAIEAWKQHTDWHFWHPYNHAVLADLYIRAGRLDEAAQTLPMLRGTEHYDETVAALEAAREHAERLDAAEQRLPELD